MFTSVWKNEILLQRKPKVYVTKHLLFGINWFQRFCAPRDKKGFSRHSIMEPIAKTRSKTWNIQKHFHK